MKERSLEEADKRRKLRPENANPHKPIHASCLLHSFSPSAKPNWGKPHKHKPHKHKPTRRWNSLLSYLLSCPFLPHNIDHSGDVSLHRPALFLRLCCTRKKVSNSTNRSTNDFITSWPHHPLEYWKIVDGLHPHHLTKNVLRLQNCRCVCPIYPDAD